MLMKRSFYKYQGTGNDFILINNLDEGFEKNEAFIAQLCHRRFGIGADGLICLEKDPEFDFRMVYFNSDGKESTFCGNGGRCIVSFAFHMGLIAHTTRFRAKDGVHEAELLPDKTIKLKMADVDHWSIKEDQFEVFTGSPHLVVPVAQLQTLDVKKLGASIRYSQPYEKEGINVNFVDLTDEIVKVRTYERGVEDETYSCGTGATAVALWAWFQKKASPIHIETPGGPLRVEFRKESSGGFSNVFLIGPATFVFSGELP